jgi:DsbC/DsbD-like thiol-disulfide interchange protein/cytochrome c biogenesis protein CcdA
MLLIRILATAWLLGANAALAASSAPVTTARTTARIVTDTDSVAPGHTFRIALELTPAPGWHTYWHNPGDAGAAPSFDPEGVGIVVGGIQWPLPQRIADGTVMSFGYAGPVLLTREVTPKAPGPLTLNVEANWLVCAQLCVPEHGSFRLSLPAGLPAASPERAAIDAAARTVPGPSPWPSRIGPDGTLWLRGVPAGKAVFLPDASDTTVLGAVQPVHRRDGVLTLKLTPTPLFRADAPTSGVLVLGEGASRVGYRLDALPGAPPASVAGAASSPAWSPGTFMLAIAGGLLLNLMPCVFPVLAMKAMALAGLSGAARGRVRLLAWAYTGGVLLSCLAMALLLLALRAAGATAGWGFQFQYPAFVAAMAWLFFAIGLNLSGAFALGSAWGGVGQRLAARGGVVGSFATGLLAVLVATPCTAPFMGVAVAAAATAPAAQAIAVFLALGLGFALPWVLLAMMPQLISALPAPGRWMGLLQQGLAFPMYAAAVWLVWVISQEAGSTGVLGVGAGFVLIALGAWIATQASGADRLPRMLAHGLSACCVVAAFSILPGIAHVAAPALSRRAMGDRYSPATLSALRQDGRPVLVNMTAAWCVTCLVNERVAIQPSLPSLDAHRVAYLTGDWTRQDPQITEFLRHYGRVGVPLYVFFPAGSPTDSPGQILPQILTPRLLQTLQ